MLVEIIELIFFGAPYIARRKRLAFVIMSSGEGSTFVNQLNYDVKI